jgi:hypothetical protein
MKKILFLCLVMPWVTYAAALCELGVASDQSMSPQSIVYRAAPKVRYSDARIRPFSMIVFHDPGSAQCDPSSMITYGQTYDKRRDGMYGYHFYIARDGTVYQGAPLAKRTNHVSGDFRRTPLQYSNSSAIGISLMCGHMKIPALQLQAAVRLAHMLQVAYNIPSNRIFGHGELQFNRLPNEGLIAARATRTSRAQEYDAVAVKAEQIIQCGIRGTPSSPCTGDACEVFVQKTQKSIDGLPPGLYKILTSNSGYDLPNGRKSKFRFPSPKDRYQLTPKYLSSGAIMTDAESWGYSGAPARYNGNESETHFTNPLDDL